DGEAPVSRYARTYDALMAAMTMAHGHHGCQRAPGPKAVINITVPLSTLMGLNTQNPNPDPGQLQNQDGDQTPVPGPCGGGGPARTEDGNVLAASVVRAMAPEAQLRRLVFDDRTGLPLDLGRAQRLAPGYLRTLAFAKHSTCAWGGGCDVPVSRCEADHITEFSHGGTTSAANLQPLCSTHNRLKYRRNTRRTRNKTGTGAGAKAPPGSKNRPDGEAPPGPPGAAGPPDSTG
uniref:HNH endonuclease signature motif containing protein n=1 Tax=Nocardiopsis xinjiangensis TaxID=124285 RepID=UPI000524623A